MKDLVKYLTILYIRFIIISRLHIANIVLFLQHAVLTASNLHYFHAYALELLIVFYAYAIFMVCRMPHHWDCGSVKNAVTLHRRKDKTDKDKLRTYSYERNGQTNA